MGSDLDDKSTYSFPNFQTVEEYQQFVGKKVTYFPYNNGSNIKFVNFLGNNKRTFEILKIKKGLKQDWKEILRTDWKIKDVMTNQKYEIVIYSGDYSILKEHYNNMFWEDEVRIMDLPIFNCLGDFSMSLTKVEKPENPDIQYGDIKTITDSITKYSYEDNFLDIVLFGEPEGISFVLKNKSQHTLKILWDEASFVDVDGSTSKIMHNGVKFSERENAQPPSTIIRGANLLETIIPTRNVYWDDTNKDWKAKSIYPVHPFDGTKQTILMLPIQIKGVTNEYLFIFETNFNFIKE